MAASTDIRVDRRARGLLCLRLVERFWIAPALLLVLVGCETNVQVVAPEQELQACDGALGATPRVLATGLDEGWLLETGDYLVHVPRYSGQTVRIDRCSGATALVGETPSVMSAAIHGSFVYLVENGESFGMLVRRPLAGGAPEWIAETSANARLVTHDSGVYLRDAIAPGDLDVGIFELDEATGELALRHRIDSWDGIKIISTIGASDAGIYFRESYDCGCNAGLHLWPFDGSDVRAVAGTAGAWSVGIAGSDLFVGAERDPVGFGSVVVEIVRLPLEGGEPDVIVEASEEHTYDVRRVAANASAVCWTTWGNPPRCIRRRAGAELRLMDTEGGDGAQPLVLTDDAAYWLRPAPGGPDLELVAAVP
jgi:hypothetical protein